MTAPAPIPRPSLADYLDHERRAVSRHEFRDGQIVAMAGGSYAHSLITTNFLAAVHAALRGKPCRVLDSNLRVATPRPPLYTYPDATVVCGPVQFDPADVRNETILNPRLLAEVLSPSTEAYDRGEKFTRYRLIATLQEYVLISQDTPRIETFFRRSDGTWLFSSTAGLTATLHLASIEVALALHDVYAGVDFPPAADAALSS